MQGAALRSSAGVVARTRPDFTPWLCSWPDSSRQGQGFPMRFWPKWRASYAADPMLHLFCGASDDGDTRVDVRPEAKGATLVGDFRKVELPAGHYASAFADPPYTEQYAAEWRQKFPRPADILRVMRDSVRDGGAVGVLHMQVIRPVKGLRAVAYHPVFCGTTKHIRCLSVFRKEPH
jgi:hypothetical protein